MDNLNFLHTSSFVHNVFAQFTHLVSHVKIRTVQSAASAKLIAIFHRHSFTVATSKFALLIHMVILKIVHCKHFAKLGTFILYHKSLQHSFVGIINFAVMFSFNKITVGVHFNSCIPYWLS